ncbi:sugar transferase [Sphingomonas baiyangensis]|uniref:sugar transferase n=1 Tax=Sphingomonas baiyangensis TaxID=2572576 RepID=UPI00146CF5BB|nr:sugar transferase [Sphingomonas baiyangensis]
MKRLTDLVLAGGALLVLSPVLLAVALAIALRDGRPVLFRQQRPGLRGRPFDILKFRTMRVAAEPGALDATTARVTPLGRFLRATSLDELPALWNVVRGDMSLVGPRPLLMQYLPLYSPEQARRHEVRPGITGWAQVNGRNAIDWERKFALDVWYVDNRSWWLDLRILWMTVMKVVRRADIDAGAEVTMQPFTGNGERR